LRPSPLGDVRGDRPRPRPCARRRPARPRAHRLGRPGRSAADGGMFILSDVSLPGHKPARPVWISHDGDAVHVAHDASGGVFVFEGRLFADRGLTPDDLARQWSAGPADMRTFKGRYAGAYAEAGTGRVSAFSDHLGIDDVYVWRRDG